VSSPDRQWVRPKRLSPGETIGVVAPAGRVDPLDLHQGVLRLEQLGFKVILGKEVEKSHRYFAGKDIDRAADLQSMFERSDVRAILSARGGSGTARLLRFLDPDRLRAFPKIFVGCSDITTLLLYFARTFGWVTFHGPMAATQFGRDPNPVRNENFIRLLRGEAMKMSFPSVQVLRAGQAEGVLTGGCLTLICTTIGTPYEIETEGKILFIEDIDEAPYRIDRMLTYLKQLGKFDQIRGIIFGQMPRCQPELLPEIILEILDDFPGPILFGFPSGHGESLATLPFGVPMEIDGKTGTLRMLAPAVL